MSTAIPCRKPKVAVIQGPGHRTPDGSWGAVCAVPRCDWAYINVIKSDVQQHASWHKGDHRGAVPKTEILRFNSGVYQATCNCGWKRSPDGPHTKSGNQKALEHHLTYEHGLAVCP